MARVGDGGNRADRFGGDFAVQLHIAVELFDDRAHEGRGFFGFRCLLVDLRVLGGVVVALVDQLFQQIVGTLCALALQYRFERIQPFLRFQGIGIVGSGQIGDG